MPSVFMGEQARALVLLHAAAAIVLIGSTTHHCLIALGYLRGSYKLRLGRIYAATMPCLPSLGQQLVGSCALPG